MSLYCCNVNVCSNFIHVFVRTLDLCFRIVSLEIFDDNGRDSALPRLKTIRWKLDNVDRMEIYDGLIQEQLNENHCREEIKTAPKSILKRKKWNNVLNDNDVMRNDCYTS